MKDESLQENFKSKLRTADEAVRMIRLGQRVFIGSSCGEPQHLVSAMLPLHFALIQVSPPDDDGWMSLSISVDVTLAAARSAAVVIAQVNSMMPRIPRN